MVSFNQRLELASMYMLNKLKLNAPKDTWNLTLNAIVLVQLEPNRWRIVIGGEVAPYAVYTNEQWISDKWHGKQNPNEGWIDDTIEECIPYINSVMGGSISVEDVEQALANIDSSMNDKFQESINRIKLEGGFQDGTN